MSEVFAYVDDYNDANDWMYGLHTIVSVGEQTSGVGATYDGVMELGPMPG